MNTRGEKKHWSDFLVVAALCSFCAIIGLVAGVGFRDSPDAAVFAKWIENHQTLLVSAVAILGLVLAQNQLTEMRRQHVATVKRLLREELDALSNLKRFAESILAMEIVSAATQNGKDDLVHFWIPRPSPEKLTRWKEVLPSEVSSYAEETLLRHEEFLGTIRSRSTDVTSVIKAARTLEINAQMLLRNVEEQEHKISQYWS